MFGQSLLSGAFGSALDPGLYFGTKLYDGNGGPNSIGGKINGAGRFNGSTSNINFGSGGIQATSAVDVSFSISWWMNSTATDTSTLFNTYGSGSGSYGFTTEMGNGTAGKLKLWTNWGGNVVTGESANAINDGNWHHIVLVKDQGSTMKVYVDTSEVLSANINSGSQVGNPLVFGYYTDHAAYEYTGQLDQARMFNTALTTAQIASLYAEDTSTAGTLDFPVGAGCQAAYTLDSSANNIIDTTTDASTCNFPTGAGCQALYEFEDNVTDTCSNYNGTANNITYASGLFSKAAVFNGSNADIDISSSVINVGNPYSISMWLNFPDVTAYKGFFANITSSRLTNEIAVCLNNGKITIYSVASDGNTNLDAINATPQLAIANNIWYHVVIIADRSLANKAQVYFNGVEASYTYQSQVASTAAYSDTKIGIADGAYFNGNIDQVRIFNTAITQSQVTELARGSEYNGASSNVTYNGFIKFQPGLTWIKRTSSTEPYALYDSVRGPNEQLSTDSSGTQATNAAPYEGLTSFDSYGFSLDNNGGVNGSSQSYVSWNWKAGGSGSDNFYKDGTGYASAALAGMNTGSLTPTKSSVNTENGLSIVTLNSGNSTADVTVSHGLGVKPAFVLFKKLNSEAGGWFTWHQSFSTESYYLYLQDDYAFSGLTQSGNAWGNQSFDTNNISFRTGWTVETNRDLVIYSFAEIAKYSKMGTYVGNAGSNPINVGFQPTWVMAKPTSSSGSWLIMDSTRGANEQLYANLSAAQYTDSGNSFSATGFTMKSNGNWNSSGVTYIYVAFA